MTSGPIRALATSLLLVLLSSSVRAQPVRTDPAEGIAFFEKTIRPLLSEHCHSCHGPNKQQAGLRLDSRGALLKGGENGPAIKPGLPEASLLIQAVRRKGERKMPPRTPLPPQAVEALTHWVKLGAPWPEKAETVSPPLDWKRHWAFQPIRAPKVPPVKNASWAQTSIDPFILARLEANQLAPSPAADRLTLLRRVTFDLLGLPPTPEEIDAFVKDPAPDAYHKVVERLLASPHYGERWARYWLDVARYADTKGYVFFEEANYPWAWTYRDYVIRAFNEDLPYNQFLLEQLAADRLPLGKDRRPLTALGFVTVGGHFMNNPHDILDDRIDVVTRGLLGLTVTCARCHDHKFDPITQKDYYGLYGIFASSVEPRVPPLFNDPPTTPEYRKFAEELAKREKALDDFLHTKQTEVIVGSKKRAAEYLLAAHAMRNQPSTQEFMLIADGNDLNPAMLARWRGYLERAQRKGNPVFVAWERFGTLEEKTFAQQAAQIAVQLVVQQRGVKCNPVVAHTFARQPPQSMNEVAQRYAELLQNVEQEWQKAVETARQNKKPGPNALPDPAREEIRQVFHAPDAPPNVRVELFEELALLPDRPSQAKLQELRKAVEQWRATGPGAPPRAMALEDTATPYQPRIFLRGNPGRPGEAVPRQFLSLLGEGKDRPFTDGSGRLELAKAIVDPKNPLTARVLVNRIWMHHFGVGLVKTPSDFGLRSDPPSHPALLDHLALTFCADGWSIKKLHRRIVLSATYQQQSLDRPEARTIDPENALFWRMNRQRLDFEATRDALLAVSGRLERTIGGPSTKDLLSAKANRRTLYGYLDRLNVPGIYRTFDFPSPDATSPKRDPTTVPQQALFFMNHPFLRDCARQMLKRADVANLKDRHARIDRLTRLCLGRGASAEELQLAQDFLGTQDQPARWEEYVQALFLLNEFVFID